MTMKVEYEDAEKLIDATLDELRALSRLGIIKSADDAQDMIAYVAAWIADFLEVDPQVLTEVFHGVSK